MKNGFAKGYGRSFGKIFLPCFLILCVPFWAGCTASPVGYDASSDILPDKMPAPENSDLTAENMTSSAVSEGEPAAYGLSWRGNLTESCAQITKEGILLSDGRLVTKQGVLMPDGTFIEEDTGFVPSGDRNGFGGTITLSDGTTIHDMFYTPDLDAFDPYPPIFFLYRQGDEEYAVNGEDGVTLSDGRMLTPEGTMRLPDGTETEIGYVQKDGTVRYGKPDFDDWNRDPTLPGAILILSDGTRIVDPYGISIRRITEEDLESVG